MVPTELEETKCEYTFTVGVPITNKLYTIDNRAFANTTAEGILEL